MKHSLTMENNNQQDSYKRQYFLADFTEDCWILIRSKILSNKVVYGRDVSSLTTFLCHVIISDLEASC